MDKRDAIIIIVFTVLMSAFFLVVGFAIGGMTVSVLEYGLGAAVV